MADTKVFPVMIGEKRGKAALSAFIDVQYTLNKSDPHWVPPLRADVKELLDPAKNPFFEHADVQPMLATRDGRIVGRITAHIDRLALTQPREQGMGPGTGFWGLFEAEDRHVAAALIEAAEAWLVEHGMKRALGPISMSIWDEPGLLTKGFRHDPTVMMGHHRPEYESWIRAAGYSKAKTLYTYELDITRNFPPLVQRIVQAGERNARIRIRGVDKSRFEEEAATILGILNDAWHDNWGFVPITDREIDYVGKKLKPIVREDLIMIAELDDEPVAFMMTLPNVNEAIKPLEGSLYPLGWISLLLWLRHCRARTMRVPLMGVRKSLQNSRMASQLAFMLIEQIRHNAHTKYGSQRGEIGWILDDNQGMIAIADAIHSKINREYVIFEKGLS